MQEDVGERDGHDREQAAEHGDEAEQAAGGGDRERGVRARVEQADRAELGELAEGCAGGDAPGEHAEDDDAHHARGGDAAE